MRHLSRSAAKDGAGGPELSVVIPMHNEQNGLAVLFDRLKPVLEDITSDYEIVCVDDGSTDATLAGLIVERQRDERVKIIVLSRNFGKDVALTAGLDHASGRAVVPMDADLQDPPEVIADLHARWQEGYEVVYAQRSARDADSFAKRLTAGLFYRFHNAIADVHIPQNTGDFRLMDRKVVDVLRQMPERNRFMKGMFAWVGFRQTGVEYSRPARAAGETKWNYWKLWNFAIDGIVSGSSVPLRIWTYAGSTIALLAFLYAGFLVVRTAVYGVDVPGYASIMVAVLLLGGINIFALGILGEYLGRIFAEVQNRPLYLINRNYGIGEPARPEDEWKKTSTAA